MKLRNGSQRWRTGDGELVETTYVGEEMGIPEDAVFVGMVVELVPAENPLVDKLRRVADRQEAAEAEEDAAAARKRRK